MTATPTGTHPTLAPEDWVLVKALFDAAIDQPAERWPALVAASGASEAVQAEVLSLLGQPVADPSTADDDFLSPAADRLAASLSGVEVLEDPGLDTAVHAALAQAAHLRVQADAPLLPPGTRLGPWEVVGPLGMGGMAEVLSARRADGAWEGEAAVKVLKRGMDSAAVLARFALEQRALARLNHPHIARLLDAGLGPAGLPYFVMEKVNGRPIDQACEGQSVEARLALFLQLADAVSFAHRQLLVHRDLKPSNVLVDESGQVKLLDFGIAKALDPLEAGQPWGADAAAGITRTGQRPYTPHYASPEQVKGEPVGTGTDLYSLGVLLYVMLTGLRPYGRSATTPLEAARSVLEEEPTRPSALSPGLVADPQWMATRRRLRGDLDNILLKTLEKAPERRYLSVDALVADIQAHLAGFPVSARPPSWGYRAGKFVHRNTWAVGAAAVAVLALVGGSGVALWQARIAQAERDIAQQRFAQVRQLANRLVFKYHDQIENLPGATAARQALLLDAAAFMDGLRQAAEDDPTLAQEVAETYYRISRLQGVDMSIHINQHDQAEANLDKALALSRGYASRPEAPLPAVAVAVNMAVSRAELWQRRGQMAEADAAIRQTLPALEAALRRAPADAWPLTSAISLHGVHARILGSSLAHASLGRWREACAAADRARAAADANLAADPRNAYGPDSLAFALGEQAQCRLLAGQSAEAVALFERQTGLRDAMAAKFPDDMDFRYQRAVARGNLALALSALGQHGPARQRLDEASRLAQAAAAADPGNQAATPRLHALVVARARLALQARQPELARAALAALLAEPPPSQASFAELRWQAEAGVLAARAWRPVQPARALALAQAAEALLHATRVPDDNLSRRWLQAQALGEMALAQAALDGARPSPQAVELARQALAAWADPAAPDGPPPPLLRQREPALLALAGPH